MGTGVPSVPFFVARLKEIIRNSQHSQPVRLVLVPVAWQEPPDSSFAAQAALLHRAEREISLAENDPDFVMIMPFLYQDNINFSGDPTSGVSSIPIAKKYYQALGKHVTMANTPRLAFPSSTAASSSIAGGDPDNAFDVDDNTMWSSGGYAPAWLRASFLDPIVVTNVSLRAAMAPNGPVVHRVIGYSQIASFTLANYGGGMSDGQVWAPPANSAPGGMIGVAVDTTASPSWVGWRTFDIYTSGTTRVYGYPVAASGTVPGGEAIYIMDGDPNTMWSSGGYGSASSPQSITLDLGQSQTISRVDLQVAQSPEGPTTHVLWGGPSQSSLSPLSTLSGYTSDGEWLSFVGTFSNVRYLAIKTTQSPSWVGWREIGIFR